MITTQTVTYSNQAHNSENLLYNFKMLSPVALSSTLTYLNGRGTSKYPFLFDAISGNLKKGGIKSIAPIRMNDTQYYVNTFGKIKRTTQVLGLVDSSITKPGLGKSSFEVDFGDGYAHNQYTLISPDGKYQIRVQQEPRSVGTASNGSIRKRAICTLYTTDGAAFVPLANFQSGKHWSLGAASVPSSESYGTAANSQGTGKMTNQFGFIRASNRIAGNISNKVVNVKLPMKDGATTDHWMPYQIALWEDQCRLDEETDLLTSEYNRDEYGQIAMIDQNTGNSVPKGAGVKQILKAGGRYDTYGIGITLSKLRHTILSGVTSGNFQGISEVRVYTGSGGVEMFTNAINADMSSKSYFQSVGDKFIKENTDGRLTYGNYATSWLTPDNILLTIVKCDHFDMGAQAQADRENGNMLNGYPLYSYNMVALEQSIITESGEPNIQIVAEQGRESIYKIVPGMSPLPEVLGAMSSLFASTEQDIASFHIMKSQGVHISDWSRSFWLEMVA